MRCRGEREKSKREKKMSERVHPVRVAGLKTFAMDQYPGPILACQISTDVRSSSQM